MTLYHYTTAPALQSIIETKSLWASDYRFLNDSSEFRYGWAIVVSVLRDRLGDLGQLSPIALSTVEHLLEHNDRVPVNAFVGSLTSEGDLLSQWRGYNGGRGFSIGFNEQWLSENATAQDFHLFRVLYDAEVQHEAARGVVNSLLTRVAGYATETTPTNLSNQFNDIVSWWKADALKAALSFKDKAFVEEQETRLIWAGSGWPTGLKTRINQAGLVPYKAFQFDKIINRKLMHPNNAGIEEIVIGPANREHQTHGVDALLASHHMRLFIRRSDIPYVAD
jgi:hypothetical protein